MPHTVMMVAAAGGSTRMGQPKQHIMLGNHPAQNRTLEKRQWMLDHPGENDFLDPTAWPEFLAAQLTRLDDFDAKGY